MLTIGLNLLISDKPDVERDGLAEAFARQGGVVQRIGRFWAPPTFDPATVRVYGADSFCLVLQQKLGLRLTSPDDELLLSVPPEFLQRQIARRTLAEAASLGFPAFIKPVVPKQFRGAVYPSFDALAKECHGLSGDTAVFVAEPVRFTAEARSFVLNTRVLDTALYEGTGQISGVASFVDAIARVMPLPSALVVDTGLVVGRGWAVVEFNALWGAGLNGCDPDKVLPAIVAASGAQSDPRLPNAQ